MGHFSRCLLVFSTSCSQCQYQRRRTGSQFKVLEARNRFSVTLLTSGKTVMCKSWFILLRVHPARERTCYSQTYRSNLRYKSNLRWERISVMHSWSGKKVGHYTHARRGLKPSLEFIIQGYVSILKGTDETQKQSLPVDHVSKWGKKHSDGLDEGDSLHSWQRTQYLITSQYLNPISAQYHPWSRTWCRTQKDKPEK